MFLPAQPPFGRGPIAATPLKPPATAIVDGARRAEWLSWWLLVAMLGSCLIAAYGHGFTIDPARAILPAIGLAILAAGTVIGTWRRQPRLAAGATAFLQMTLFTILGVVLAYVLAARAGPLWDAQLAAADRSLGIDWPAIFRAADGSRGALWVGGLAYHSLTLQMIVAIVVLSGSRRIASLRIAVAAAILAGFVTVAISGVVPAMGNVFDPAHYHNLWPSIAWLERDLIAGLRAGTLRSLDLSQLMGIVSFPSYHATLPIILAWAQRDVPYWRVGAVAWAGVTIAATPLFGGHYAVDVIGGLTLAIAAILIVPPLVLRRRSPVAFDGATGCPAPHSLLEAQAVPADGGPLPAAGLPAPAGRPGTGWDDR